MREQVRRLAQVLQEFTGVGEPQSDSQQMAAEVAAAVLTRTNGLIYRGNLGTSIGNVFIGLVLLGSNAHARGSPIA